MNLFSYVKSQLSILDVIGEYASLKKAGLYWKGCCPLHHEKTASFTVSPHKEIFYCFGCQAGGDVIAFIEKVERCSPLEAARTLIDRYKISVPATIAQEAHGKDSQERDRYFNVCKAVALWAHSMIIKYHAPRSYLTNRGFNATSIDYFTLGYFPGGPQAIKVFLNSMHQQGILADELLNMHFLAQGKTVFYSPFEERILFPIKDHVGRFCGFGGRIYKPLDERAKYYNSRESSYFSKGSLLFGFDKAKQMIQKTEAAFLVEGYLDCIAMVQHGFPATVATLGTACTSEHLMTLARHANQLFVLYDGDKAGQEAVIRLAQLCWQAAIDVKVITLPPGQDPASFLMNQDNDLKEYIDQAADIFIFFINTTAKDFQTKPLSEKLLLSRKIIDVIYTLDDPLKQSLLLQKAATILVVPLDALKKSYTNTKRPLRGSSSEPQKMLEPSPQETYPLLEKQLFFAIMQNIQLIHRNNEEYLLEFLPEPFKAILLKLKQAKDAQAALAFPQFYDMLEHDQQQIASKILLENELELSTQNFDQLLLLLQKKHWKGIVSGMKMKLEQAEYQNDKEKIETILSQFLALKKKVVQNNFLKDS